jgi:hypothetical protein
VEACPETGVVAVDSTFVPLDSVLAFFLGCDDASYSAILAAKSSSGTPSIPNISISTESRPGKELGTLNKGKFHVELDVGIENA